MRVTTAVISVLSLSLLTATALAVPSNTCKAPRVLIVLDKSSSMVTGSVGSKTKWEVAKTALAQVLSAYQGSINFGLMVFPNPNQCGPGSVKVPIGPNNAAAINAALIDPPPSGGNWTPMSQTLDAAAKLAELHDSAHSNNVLLISDGWQWCDPYDAATRFLPVSSTATLKSLGITTYVVGFGESVDALTLNKMADAAKTKISASCNVTQSNYAASNNCYYQANDPATLVGALQSVAKLITAEKCDGIDNDCNGKVDDGLSRACTSSCGTGVETCQNGAWTGCTAPTPAAETCDGKDNNCDGTVDEGCTCVEGESRSCGVTSGECQAGTQICTGGTWSACQGEAAPQVEVCDGKDNNCDGQIDENLTRPCQTACGTGIETCSGGTYGICTAAAPTKETCDGVDNDCDGVVDGPNAICPAGLICVRGTCQPAVNSGDSGCDCKVAAPPRSAPPVLFLLGLGVVLAARRRR